MNSEKKASSNLPSSSAKLTRQKLILERQKKSLLWQIIHLLGSLPFALLLLATIALACAIATFTESHANSKVAHALIYKAPWFLAWLALLCLNLFAVTLTRWPWQRKHLGFVITHYGIILLLLGAAIGSKLGFEGNVTLQVHSQPVKKITTNHSVLEIETPLNDRLYLLPFDATLARPSPTHLLKLPIPGTPLQLIIDGWSETLEEKPELIKTNQEEEHCALLLQLSSQALHQEYHVALGLGESESAHFDFFGLATIDFMSSEKSLFPPFQEEKTIHFPFPKTWSTPSLNTQGMVPPTGYQPWLRLALDPENNNVHFTLGRHQSVEKSGTLHPREKIPLGWADWQLELLESGHHEKIAFSVLPSISTETSQKKSTSTIPGFHAFLQDEHGLSSKSTWVASGEITSLFLNDLLIRVGYGLELRPIPFSIELLDFKIPRDEGTETPGDFQAIVRFHDQKKNDFFDRSIRMNHPASFPGGIIANITGINYKFSQAQWNPQNPQETTLQVLYDPGWLLKWIGSLGICLGIGMMFYWREKK